MKLKEYEWALYVMFGRTPSKKDDWQAGGSAPTLKKALREADRYLSQYAQCDAGVRYEVFKVRRDLAGARVYLPLPEVQNKT